MHDSQIELLNRMIGIAAALADENARLHEELERRKLVERAKGIIQRTYNITDEQAYLWLRNASRRARRPMRELAEEVIGTRDASPAIARASGKQR